MANPWENDPVVGAAPPWESDPVVGTTQSSAPWESDPIVGGQPWENDPIATRFDSEPEKPSAGYLGAVTGVPVIEAGASMASGMIGATLGGLYGIGKLVTGSSLQEASDAVERTTQRFTYEPRTAEGQAVLEAAATPFEKIAEFGEYLGDETLEETNSAVLATAARLAPDVALMVAPIGLKGKFKGKGRAEDATRPPESTPEGLSPESSAMAKGAEVRPTKKPIAEAVEKAVDPDSVRVGDIELPTAIAREPVGVFLDAKNKPVVPKAKNGFVQVGETFLDATGGKAITPVRKLGRENKFFRQIADMMEAPDTVDVTLAPKAVGRAFHEGVTRETGRFVSRFQDAVQPHLTRLGTMPKKVQAEVLKGLRDSTYRVADELKPLVWDIRKVLDDVYEYSKEAGVPVGYLKDYVPRVFNRKMVRDNPEAFQKILVDHGFSTEVASGIVKNIIKEEGLFDPFLKKITREMEAEQLLGIKSSKQKVTGGNIRGSKAANLEHSRVLHEIPDAAFGKFLKDDVMSLMPRYLEHAVNRAEWVRRYGVDGVKLNNLVKKGVKEAADTGQPLMRKDIERIYDIADAQQRQYKNIDTPAVAKANQWYSTYQLIRTLPLATIASAAEPLVIFMRGTAGGGFRGMHAGFKHMAHETARKFNKNIPKAEATRAAEEVGLALDHAVAERMLDAFGGESTKVTNAFFKANLLHQWTRMNRVAGYEAGKSMAIGHLQRLAGTKKFGLADKFDQAAARQRYSWELKELGVDVQKGVQWVNDGMKKSDPFYEQIRTAGIRFTNDVVMHPRVTNRPMWHSNPHYRLLSQLKGFQTTFGNTVTKRLVHEVFGKGLKHGTKQTVKFFTVLSVMSHLNMVMQEVRDYMMYGSGGNPRKSDWTYMDRYVDGLQRTGILGALQIGIDASNGYRYGSGIESTLGPGIDQAWDAAQGVSQLVQEGKTGRLERSAREAVPNIPGVRNAMKEAMSD